MPPDGMSTDEFLCAAIACVKLMTRMHDAFAVHARLTPDHIFVLPGSFEADHIEESPGNVTVSFDSETLPYMSPEQTGRLQRRVDNRSDIYALGIIFYEMLTGTMPFDAHVPIEWVHAHIALSPSPMQTATPDVLKQIIFKCIEKLPENRYQSAYGLLQDLLRVKQELATGRASFPIGERDAPNTLRIFRRLYGRSAEMRELNGLYSAVKEGTPVAVFLIGDSGLGKTALIESFLDQHLTSAAYLAVGRSTPQQRLTPYAPVANVCRTLIDEILTEDDAGLTRWRSLLSPLSQGSGLLHDLVPELSLIIGRPESQSTEGAQDLLQTLVDEVRFLISRFADAAHPVIICLDDLQWADFNSVALLDRLIRRPDAGFVMWLLAFRPQAPEHVRRLAVALDSHAEPVPVFHEMRLGSLSADDIAAVLADTLHLPLEDVQSLAGTVHSRTIGNPYYVRQFLLELIDRRYLRFDYEIERWQISYGEIARMPITQNVIELLNQQIEHLPVDTLNVMKWAACVGSETDLDFLAEAAGLPRDRLPAVLQPAFDHQFAVVASDHGEARLCFAHDQAQHAFYALIGEADRESIHDRLAWLLIARQNGEQGNVYRIVNHLNRGKRDPRHRHNWAKWNLAAGVKSYATGAFATAMSYFTVGCDALVEADWDGSHELMWELHFQRARCEFALGNSAGAQERIEQCAVRAVSDDELAQAYMTKIAWHTLLEQDEEAVKAGIKGLRRLQLSIPHPMKGFFRSLSVAGSLSSVLWRWRLRKADKLEHLPALADHRQELCICLMHTMVPAVYRTHPQLHIVLSLKMLSITLQCGDSAEAAASYSTFAMVLSNVFRRTKTARQFGLLSLRIAERSRRPALYLSTVFTFAAYVNFWTAPMATSIDYLRRAKAYAVSTGQLATQGATDGFLLIAMWYAGASLKELAALLEDCETFAARTNDPPSRRLYAVMGPLLRQLQEGGTTGAALDVRLDEFAGCRHSILSAASVLLQGYYVLGEQEIAERLVQAAHEHLNPLFVDMHAPEWHTLRCLVLVRSVAQKQRGDRLQAALMVRGCARKLRNWAAAAPENYLHKAALLRAEYLYLAGRVDTALRLYDKAMQLAHDSGFIHYEAIAAERAGEVCRAAGRELMARAYLTHAADRYRDWQAYAKVRQLLGKYPDLLSASTPEDERADVTATLDDFERDLDINAIVDVTRSISEEVILERLLRKLLTSMVLHAGAERGVILLMREDGLFVEAEGGSPDHSVLVHGRVPLDAYPELPATIIHYVQRTKEPLVLPDVRRDARFAGDPYVMGGLAASVMCLPILRRGGLIGLIYLEHATVPELFTDKQLRIVSIIGAQAAISIENAYLYETQEQRIRERTDELEASNRSLRETNDQLSHSESLRRQMISDISHDLRTPLTSILGYIEAVQEGVVGEQDVSKYLSIARERTIQVNGLIQDLLDLSKLEERYGALRQEMVSLIDLAHSIVRKYEFDVKRAEQWFRLEFDSTLAQLDRMAWDDFSPEQEIFVNVDMRRMDQVFGNLINNAIRHTPVGGRITLSVSLCRKEEGDLVYNGQNASQALFCVQDTGSGISEEDLPYIFERFYKVDRSRARESRGSGLGLAISRAIVETHGGTIWAESTVGKGSTFKVMLPIAVFVADRLDDADLCNVDCELLPDPETAE